MSVWYRCRHCKTVVGKSVECRVKCKFFDKNMGYPPFCKTGCCDCSLMLEKEVVTDD